MGGKVPTLEQLLARLAGDQHGVVSVWQLVGLGFTRRQIERRVEAGRLHRVFRGVYSAGHPARTVEAVEMAAALACGPGAVVSYWTASARWKLLRPVQALHVSVPGDRRVPGIQTHFVKQFHPHDKTKRDGIPITSVPRTLLDIAGVADERTLRRAVNQAARSGWLNHRAIQETLHRNPRRQGSKQLRAVIASVNPAARQTRSDLEVAFLKACAKYGVPTPVVNGEVMGFEVDFHWPGTNLIVELDCYEYHRTPQEFENDRRRDAALKRAGYEVLRVTDIWLDTDPADVAEAVRELLRCPG
jgi:predicted transcriptional regulator of viral defense system